MRGPVIALLCASCASGVAPRAELDAATDADTSDVDSGQADAGGLDAGTDAGSDAGVCTPIPATEACRLVSCGSTVVDDGCGTRVLLECPCDGGTPSESMLDAGCVPISADEACRLFPCSQRVVDDGCGQRVELTCSCDGGVSTEGPPDAGPLPDPHYCHSCIDPSDCGAPDSGNYCLSHADGTQSCGYACVTDADCAAGSSCKTFEAPGQGMVRNCFAFRCPADAGL